MEWSTIGAITGILGLSVTLIAFFIGWLNSKFKHIETEFRDWTRHLTAMQAEQAKRIDELYHMFYDLVKRHK